MANKFAMTATETVIRETHAESGATVYQLTSSPAINDHIYFEVPYMDPTSRYLIFLRKHDSVGPAHVWRADLERNLVTKVAETEGTIRGHAVSPDQRYFFYTDTVSEGVYDLIRIDITTLEERRWSFSEGPLTPRSAGSVTPDLRYYINSAYLGNHEFAIWRLDMETSEREIVWKGGADHCNMHPQLEPSKGRDLLIQHNRGAVLDENGRHIKLVGEIGATLYVVGIDGTNKRELPVGKPYTFPCQGHQCWRGMTGEILLTIGGGPREELLEQGNLLAVRPGDDKARVVARGAVFNHANASRDGRFFASDQGRGAEEILVGSIESGRWCVLCEMGSRMGSPQYSHGHPYLSPDNKWVVFNSIRTGMPQVFAAKVPDRLLESLE